LRWHVLSSIVSPSGRETIWRSEWSCFEANPRSELDLSKSDLSSCWSKNICQKETLVNLKPVSLSKPGHVWTEEWILTGLSSVNKSRGRISNRSSFSLKTNPDFGVILCTCTTAVQGGSCRRKNWKFELWKATLNWISILINVKIEKWGTASEISLGAKCHGIFYPTDFLFFYSLSKGDRFHIGNTTYWDEKNRLVQPRPSFYFCF
jgi:hypothetical protein